MRFQTPLAACLFIVFCSPLLHGEENTPKILISPSAEPVEKGKFEPTWESLAEYQTPEWYRDAKFGIWAHWGPQCQPEKSDWYARGMYEEGNWQSTSHRQRYGHPSEFGFKDVIHEWKAENWDPDKLVQLYKKAGAKYFVALANHHDNFDNYDSKYQPWNSVNLGPQKDLIGGWEKATRAAGLRFGVSVHASHAWTWYEPSQGADRRGPKAGVPYDGKLTKADGTGKWWEGYDPQDLYAQNHEQGKSRNSPDFWEWDEKKGTSQPDQAYCDKFYNRTIDLINKYNPDFIYFDDTVLPLWPISDAGLKIAAHFYNHNMAQHGGKLEAVLNGKILSPEQRKCMVWDIERGASNRLEPLPWQTCTCIGDWHYNRDVFTQHRYRPAKKVIHALADIVSKNGNLLLSVPVRGDGSIDEDEIAVVEKIGEWMAIHGEAIYGTRPWKVFGEGPALASAKEISAQGFNEGSGKPFTAADIRFTKKGDVLYAIALGKPDKAIQIASLGKKAGLFDKPITKIQLLGSQEDLQWEQGEDALVIQCPQNIPSDIAVVFKIQ